MCLLQGRKCHLPHTDNQALRQHGTEQKMEDMLGCILVAWVQIPEVEILPHLGLDRQD